LAIFVVVGALQFTASLSTVSSAEAFTANVPVGNPMGLNQAFPKVDIAPDGTVYVIWSETVNQTFNRDVRLAKSMDAGSTFLPSVLIPRDGTFTSEDMGNLAVGSDGVVHVAWEDWRNDADGMFVGDGGIDGVNNSDIFYGRSSDGGMSFSQVKVNDDNTTLAQSFPIGRTMAVGDDSKVHIVWNDRRNSSPPLNTGDVYYSNSVDGTSFKANLKVSDSGVQGPGNPSIAVSGADRIFVAYDGYDVSMNTSAIYLTHSLDGGATFDGSRRVSIGGNASYPSLASEGNKVVIAWRTEAPSTMIYVRVSADNGTTFGPETPVETPASLTVYFSTSIEIDRFDRVAVSWYGGISADWDVFYSSSADLGTTFSPIQRVNDDVSGRKQYAPSVALDGNGYVYLAWSDARVVTHNDIYFARAPPELADLVISPPDISFIPGGPVDMGTLVTIGATVHNLGDRNGSQVGMRFHDGQPSVSNQIDVDQVIPSIQYFGGSATASVIWPAGPPGWHDICVVVDPENDITESNETNNEACRSIEVIIPPIPDLAISPSDIVLFPPPYVQSVLVRVNATVHNIGGNVSGATVVRFHDGVPPSPVIGIDQPLAPIPAGGQDNVSVLWIPSTPGLRDICVVADPDDTVAEIDETNNMACVPVQVLSLPDLAPTSIVTVPPSPIPEGTLSRVNVTIVNAGDLPAGGFDLLLFDDWNGNCMPDAGEDIVTSLITGLAGHSQTNHSFVWSATPPGLHSLGAYADPPPGMVTESDETNNVACVSIMVQPGPPTRPDYAPTSPQPLPPIRTGLSSPVSLSIEVLNQGNGTATDNAIIAFHEQSSPPFSTFVLNPLAPAATSSRFIATWTAPAVPGTYSVSVDVDYDNNVSEWDETNNVYSWMIEVVAGPVTSLVIGNPNYTSTVTYVKSVTPLDLFVLDQSGFGIRNTTYTIDGGNPVNYTATGTFFLAGEGEHTVYWRSLDWAGNLEDLNSKVLRVDDIPPATTLAIGDPEYLVGGNFVTSSTPLTLLAVDGGVTPVGLDYTEYRIDGGNWETYSSSFSLAGEGAHVLEYRTVDLLGNSEAVQSMQMTVDDTPPTTAISIGEPKFLNGGNFIKSSTLLTLSVTDGGVGPNSTFYRIWDDSWSQWRDYSTSFGHAGRDGTWYVEFLSFDYLGNVETVRNETLILDDTPPTTMISSSAPFTLTATDSGCGVNVTMYRIDGGSWTVYSGGFTLTEGEHTIYYYSIDNLGNVEQERLLVVKPPIEVAVNYKPIVAMVFAIILGVAGIWSSKRRPWKGGKERMAVVKAFTITSLPFVLAEAATGVVSLLTGQLSIPPLVGAGTAVDSTILLAGMVTAILRIVRIRSSGAGGISAPQKR
jgi:subtilase family serine protease